LFFSLHILPLSGGIINSGNHRWAFEDIVGVGFLERYSFVENLRLVYNQHNIGVLFALRDSCAIKRLSGRKPLD
jgi:hypothetical protein